MIRLYFFPLLFILFIHSISQASGADSISNPENTGYLLVHQYPASKDSDYFGAIVTHSLDCEVGEFSDYGKQLFKSLKYQTEEKYPGGYAFSVSENDFWLSVNVGHLYCNFRR